MEVGSNGINYEIAPEIDLFEAYADQEVTIFGISGTFKDLAGMCPVDLNSPGVSVESKNEFVVKAANEAGLEIEPKHEQLFNQIIEQHCIERKFTIATVEINSARKDDNADTQSVSEPEPVREDKIYSLQQGIRQTEAIHSDVRSEKQQLEAHDNIAAELQVLARLHEQTSTESQATEKEDAQINEARYEEEDAPTQHKVITKSSPNVIIADTSIPAVPSVLQTNRPKHDALRVKKEPVRRQGISKLEEAAQKPDARIQRPIETQAIPSDEPQVDEWQGEITDVPLVNDVTSSALTDSSDIEQLLHNLYEEDFELKLYDISLADDLLWPNSEAEPADLKPLELIAQSMPELPTPIKQANEAISTLAEMIEDTEDPKSEKILMIIEDIIALPENLKKSVDAKPQEIEQKLENLFTLLFEEAGIEYNPELIQAFVKLTQEHYLESFLRAAMPVEEKQIKISDKIDGYEFLKVLGRRASAAKKVIINFYEIGKSVLKLYGLKYSLAN